MKKKKIVIVAIRAVLVGIFLGVVLRQWHLASIDALFEDEYLLSSSEYYDEKGKLTRFYNYKYNDRHQLISESGYNGENFSCVFKYNSDGQLISEIRKEERKPNALLGEKGRWKYEYTNYEYCDNGKISSETVLDSKKQPVEKKLYTYDKEGKVLTNTLEFLKIDPHTIRFEYNYDEDGKIDTYTVYRSEDNSHEVIKKYYDAWGHELGEYGNIYIICFDRYGTQMWKLDMLACTESGRNRFEDLNPQYDQKGNLIKVRSDNSMNADYEISFEYDVQDRIQRAEYRELPIKGDSEDDLLYKIAEWEYFADGRYSCTQKCYYICGEERKLVAEVYCAYNSERELIYESNIDLGDTENKDFPDVSADRVETHSKYEDVVIDYYDRQYNKLENTLFEPDVQITLREYDDHDNLISLKEYRNGKAVNSELYTYVLCR